MTSTRERERRRAGGVSKCVLSRYHQWRAVYQFYQDLENKKEVKINIL
jgi:hypothetical protein